MIIIGITGTLGAGKGTIVDLLIKDYDFLHFSARAFLIEEIKKLNLEINRDSMTWVANSLRAKHTPSYIVDKLLEVAEESKKNCVIESIRTPAEVQVLRNYKHSYLFAVDADSKVRYDRVKQRGSETDHILYEVFLQNEEREMNSDDPNKQNLQACIAQADFVFNNAKTIADLQKEVRIVLQNIGIK